MVTASRIFEAEPAGIKERLPIWAPTARNVSLGLLALGVVYAWSLAAYWLFEAHTLRTRGWLQTLLRPGQGGKTPEL